MRELASALVVFALLCASAGAGLFVRPRLPEHHRVRETTELMQVTIGLLATFAALVLGLLTASVKQAYDTTSHDREAYALELGLLDQCLRDYGPETATAREQLHSYTAAVIASTWPSEPAPEGVQYPKVTRTPGFGAPPELSAMVNHIGVKIARLDQGDSASQKMQTLCSERYRDLTHSRLSLIEDKRNEPYGPFYQVLAFWLMIMFGCFGLVAPRNSLAVVTIALCALSLSSVIFVILDLSTPYEGFFSIPSTGMRRALAAMLRPGP
jgi:hypothetical protein